VGVCGCCCWTRGWVDVIEYDIGNVIWCFGLNWFELDFLGVLGGGGGGGVGELCGLGFI
jgi:hypothetical protein